MSQLNAKSMERFKNFLLAALLIFTLFTPRQVFARTAPAEEKTPGTAAAAEIAETAEIKPLSLSRDETGKIETFVREQMDTWKIPGISVVIVREGQTVYQEGFGFADLGKKTAVTPTTLFELGSSTKAFTGLAVLQLEEKGMLKLTDPVDQYLPWLKMKYQGKEVPVTIGNMLYHTSGLLHFETLSAIPPSSADNALEKAARTLVGRELSFPPGGKFSYTSIGYDVLGLIIREVSGLSYEEYMKKNMFMPLQMNNTFLPGEEAAAKDMATGYKICFRKPAAYDAPAYRGNAPAGYVITSAGDLAKWLKIQMGTVEPGGFNKELIKKSHIPNPDLAFSNYGAGWMIFPNSGLISHGGLNPDFSSFIGFDEKVGVGVLTNMGTSATTGIGSGILMILRGMEPRPQNYDMNVQFDNISMKVVLALSILIILALVLLALSIVKIIKKKKRFSFTGVGRMIVFIVVSVLLAAWVYLITHIPSLLGFHVSLSFGFVWMPASFALAIYWLLLGGFLFYLVLLSVILFPKQKG